MHIITVEHSWDMAHRVPLHQSKCKHLHGHRYRAEFTFQSNLLTREGFVWDFGEAKLSIKAWIDENWDHNTVYQMDDKVMGDMNSVSQGYNLKAFYGMKAAPTVENLVFELATQLPSFMFTGMQGNIPVMTEIRLWETPTCSAVWRPR